MRCPECKGKLFVKRVRHYEFYISRRYHCSGCTHRLTLKEALDTPFKKPALDSSSPTEIYMQKRGWLKEKTSA